MEDISIFTKLCLNISTVQTIISKKLDHQLSVHGINLSEYLILFHLGQAFGKKMRRIDLAEKIGLSASGITRLVAPMVKIGLVHKEANKRDARVSLVKLSASGQRILKESTVYLNSASKEVLVNLKKKDIDEMLKMLIVLGGNIKEGNGISVHN